MNLPVRANFAAGSWMRTLAEEQQQLQRTANGWFRWLLPCQLLVGLFVALSAWSNPWFWAATCLGSVLVSLVVLQLLRLPHAPTTRILVTAVQLLLTVCLTPFFAGESLGHFYVFATLAMLSLYVQKSLLQASAGVLLTDYFLRILFWPDSVIDLPSQSFLQYLERPAWIVLGLGLLGRVVDRRQRLLNRLTELREALAEQRGLMERRLNERTEGLREARDYLQNILDSLESQVCILDKRGCVLSTNLAWERARNVEGLSGAASGQNHIEACRRATGSNAQSARRLAVGIEQVIAGPLPSYTDEFECSTVSGKRWFQASIYPFIGADGAAAVVSHTDITERVIAERALDAESSKSRALARIVSDAPFPIYIMRQSDLTVIEANQGACDILGYTAAEIKGFTPADFDCGLNAEQIQGIIGPLLDGDATHCEFRTVHRKKSGETFPVQINVHSDVYQGESVFFAFVSDLTRVQLLERQLSQARKLESIGQLAAGVAHEINTPMQFIGINVEYLRESLPRVFDVIGRVGELVLSEDSQALNAEGLQEARGLLTQNRFQQFQRESPAALEDCAEGIERVVEIISALREFSHPGGKEKEAADLNKLLLSSTVVTKNHWKLVATLTTDLAEGLPQLVCYPAEISQVLLNLIVNASDAIASTRPQHDGRIHLKSFQQDDFLVIECSDNGGGIPDDLAERIFDPFFTTKEVGKGTGQGLAISHNIVVKKHGGQLDLESTPGVGAKFIIRLPISRCQTESDSKSLPTLATEQSNDPSCPVC